VTVYTSKHFRLPEFACKCCGLTLVDDSLLQALDQLREMIGRPVKILSGCRCFARNRAVGGATDSQHLCSENRLTRAADFTVPEITINSRVLPAYDLDRLYRAAIQVAAFKAGGIGVYTEGFIHADTRSGGSARWSRQAGHYGLISALVPVRRDDQ